MTEPVKEQKQETKMMQRIDPGPIAPLRTNTLADRLQLANVLAKSDIVPTSFRGKPENIFIAIEMGAEVGLNPMQAVQSIYVVNGRPSLWGDAVLGIVQASGLLEYCEETFDPKTNTATCKVKRKNDPVEVVQTFSLADAKQAGLVDKNQSLYKVYPARMCKMRARSWAIRDKFADLLRGLQVREEVEDYIETTGEVAQELPLRKSQIESSEPLAEQSPTKGIELVTQEDRKAIADLAASKDWTPDQMKELLGRRYSILSSKDLPKDKLSELKDIIVNGEPAPEVA
jgi:hypothetical protein